MGTVCSVSVSYFRKRGQVMTFLKWRGIVAEVGPKVLNKFCFIGPVWVGKEHLWAISDNLSALVTVSPCVLVTRLVMVWGQRKLKRQMLAFLSFSCLQDCILLTSQTMDTVYLLILQLVMLVVTVYCFALMFYLQLITFETQHRLLKHLKENKWRIGDQSIFKTISFGKPLSTCYVQIV